MRQFALLLLLSAGFAWSVSAEVLPSWTRLSDAAAVARLVKPNKGTAAAKFVQPGEVELPATLSTALEDRSFWDIDLPCDMKLAGGLEFDFSCSDFAPVASFSIYCKSGEGWYSGTFSPAEEGKVQRVIVPKTAFRRAEGKVEGWGKISKLRIAVWRAKYADTTLRLANLALYGTNPNVLVMSGDSCRAHNAKEDYVGQATTMTELLTTVGLSPVQVADLELDTAALKGVKLVVLPYNPIVPPTALACLKDFRAKGGRFLVCYSLCKEMADLMALTVKGWRSARHNPALGRVEGVARVGDGLAGQPPMFHQKSSNMTESAPRGEGRVLGLWADKEGQPVGPAALVETAAGFHLGHIWMGTGEEARALMRALATAVDPALAETCAAAERKAREQEEKDAAWVAAQPSKAGEWRAFWCHSEEGLGGAYTWDDSIRILKENGFNAFLPNLAWGGKIFPTEACLAACRKYGVACHIWKVCWRARQNMKDFTPPGDCQKSFDGKVNKLWMCPSDPKNLTAETEMFVTLAKLNPTGVHMDYIRYPDNNHCFCEGCRARFEATLGRKVVDWPKDVRKDADLADQWAAFRSANITALVRAVSTRVRRECPGVEVSAAVFHNVASCPKSVGQPWAAWCREGLLDFACPMDYYMGSTVAFRNLISAQVEACAGGKAKIRPGLGISCWKRMDRDAFTMAEQIGVVRDLGLDGFTVFNYDARAVRVLPTLHNGPLK